MDSSRRSGNFRGVKIALIIYQTLALIGAVILLITSIIAIGNVNIAYRGNESKLSFIICLFYN